MDTTNHKSIRGRAARAADLIADLDCFIPLGHPARPMVRELQELFSPRDNRIRELLDRVPGQSLRAKGERIGIPRGAVWAIWHGRYRPTPAIMARIEAAAGENTDAS